MRSIVIEHCSLNQIHEVVEFSSEFHTSFISNGVSCDDTPLYSLKVQFPKRKLVLITYPFKLSEPFAIDVLKFLAMCSDFKPPKISMNLDYKSPKINSYD